MIVAFSAALYAHLSGDATELPNRSTHYDVCMAFFCMVYSGLAAWEYWHDNLLRLIAGTIALTAVNNFLDEAFFDPFTLDWNEGMFIVIITTNFVFTLAKITMNGRRPESGF